MKKFLLTVFVFLCFFNIKTANSFVRYEEKDTRLRKITILGYQDYCPISWTKRSKGSLSDHFETALQPLLDKLTEQGRFEFIYMSDNTPVDEMMQEIRKGQIDIFLGAYSQTEMFTGIHYIFPAAFINPITIFMLPNKISQVKSIDDLKNLKGVRNTNEPLSDFVNAQIAKLNPIEVDSAYKGFEKLFTREADYFITSYYNGIIEATRIGIKHQIAPAKQALWNIPVFMGVSKTSKYRDYLSKRFTKYLNDPQMTEAIKANINKIIHDFEIEYQGVVPPTFGLDKVQPSDQTAAEKANKQLDGK